MPQGLQIYNAAGALRLDTTKKITRIVSVFDSGVVAGSTTLIDDPLIEYFTVVIPSSISERCPPTTSISGNVVSWDWLAPPGGFRISAMIIVGAM